MRGSEMLGTPLEAYRVPWILYRRWQLRGLRGRKMLRPTWNSAPFFKRVRKFAKRDYFLLQVYLSILPRGTTRLPLVGFSLNLIFEYFSTVCRENSSFIKI